MNSQHQGIEFLARDGLGQNVKAKKNNKKERTTKPISHNIDNHSDDDDTNSSVENDNDRTDSSGSDDRSSGDDDDTNDDHGSGDEEEEDDDEEDDIVDGNAIDDENEGDDDDISVAPSSSNPLDDDDKDDDKINKQNSSKSSQQKWRTSPVPKKMIQEKEPLRPKPKKIIADHKNNNTGGDRKEIIHEQPPPIVKKKPPAKIKTIDKQQEKKQLLLLKNVRSTSQLSRPLDGLAKPSDGGPGREVHRTFLMKQQESVLKQQESAIVKEKEKSNVTDNEKHQYLKRAADHIMIPHPPPQHDRQNQVSIGTQTDMCGLTFRKKLIYPLRLKFETPSTKKKLELLLNVQKEPKEQKAQNPIANNNEHAPAVTQQPQPHPKKISDNKQKFMLYVWDDAKKKYIDRKKSINGRQPAAAARKAVTLLGAVHFFVLVSIVPSLVDKTKTVEPVPVEPNTHFYFYHGQLLHRPKTVKIGNKIIQVKTKAKVKQTRHMCVPLALNNEQILQHLKNL